MPLVIMKQMNQPAAAVAAAAGAAGVFFAIHLSRSRTRRISQNNNNLFQATNFVANLDYNEEQANMDGWNDNLCDDDDGIQQSFNEAITKRIQLEISRHTKDRTEQWLLAHLRENDWWIRQVHARRIAGKLGMKKYPKALYRDVYVWLPDIRWPTAAGKSEMMPDCPHCQINVRVAPHCFRDNHYGRLIVSLNTTYYTISRRYICYECQRKYNEAKEAIMEAAEQNNINANLQEVDESSYTFMAWDSRIMHLYKHGRGEEFPAFLTWRAGLDKTVLRMLPPLQDGGF